MRRALSTACVLFAAACGGERPQAPALPPLQLQPGYPQLQQLAGPEPAAPAADKQKELQDLWEATFAGGKLGARADKDLREQPDVAWFLIQQLADFDEQRRGRAAWMLGQLELPQAMVPLLLRCKDESKADGRLWLADALWRLDNDSMLLDLVQSMDRADLANDAGQSALALLQRAGIDLGASPTYAQLQEQLRRMFAHWRQHGVALRKPDHAPLDPKSQAPYLYRRLLTVSEHNLRFADEARFVLADAGVLGLPQIKLCLHATERDLRDLGLTTIIYLGRPAAPLLDDVLPLLGEKLLAATAVRALAALRDPKALPFVRPLLDSADLDLRCAAAGALGLLGDRADIPRLLALQQDDQQPLDLRVQAAFSLAVFETDRPAHAFLEQLRADGKFHGGTLDRMLEQLQLMDEQAVQPK